MKKEKLDSSKIKQRIKEMRESLGLTQIEMSKRLGISQAHYSLLENGDMPISRKHIKAICYEFNVNPNWIERGEGEIHSYKLEQLELLDIYNSLSDEGKKFLIQNARQVLLFEDTLLDRK